MPWPVCPYCLGLELLFDAELALMKSAELVDLVLILAPHLDLFAHCVLVILAELVPDEMLVVWSL